MSFIPSPETTRIGLPILLVLGYVGYHVWQGLRRTKGERRKSDEGEVRVRCEHVGDIPVRPAREPRARIVPSGELFYVQAREIPHQEIPDFANDEEYLDLLGLSAAAGYSPAMAKLGEYAIRREAWVEAFHWFSKAKNAGMKNIDPILRQIRVGWAMARRPEQLESVNELFTEEDRAVAYSRLA